MDRIRKNIIEQFGNKLRVRVCGVCIEGDKILLVNHHSLTKGDEFWGPPGGGMDFGQSSEENLKREFLEETGLIIDVERFLFAHEYLNPPLHAIELVFKVKRTGGKLKAGTDPELKKDEQIIKEVNFISFDKMMEAGKDNMHQMFQSVKSISDIIERKGYYLWKK